MPGYQAVHTGGPIKKKKKTIISGGVDAQKSPLKTKVEKITNDFYTKGSLGQDKKTSRTFTEVNRTSNIRAGKTFNTTFAKGGEYHTYADGTRVFVKKKAKKNPSRQFH